MGGFAMGYTFDSKSGLTMAALLLMIVSFYAGILFGNNAPLYVSQLVSHSSSSSSPPNNVSSNGNNLFTSPQLRTSFFHCFSSYPLLSSCKILKLFLGFLLPSIFFNNLSPFFSILLVKFLNPPLHLFFCFSSFTGV